MSPVLKVSILGNIILATVVFWLVRRGPIASGRTAGTVEAEITNRFPEINAKPSAAAHPSQESFRWSQLESTDYRTYLANLRSVGCPEQTIRDIITADLDSSYAPRRAQLERNLTAGFAARQEAETGLRELRSEEARVLATLLGDPPPATQPTAGMPAWVLARRNARPVLPLVFGNIDPAALQLDQGQMGDRRSSASTISARIRAARHQ